mmetsp:Transcript_25161/g.86201  ORF Transcript_25161/g.86201 Transcript_25161/m.86201 type:complete len:345 (+) Transcript_25161:562-1596(+)
MSRPRRGARGRGGRAAARRGESQEGAKEDCGFTRDANHRERRGARRRFNQDCRPGGLCGHVRAAERRGGASAADGGRVEEAAAQGEGAIQLETGALSDQVSLESQAERRRRRKTAQRRPQQALRRAGLIECLFPTEATFSRLERLAIFARAGLRFKICKCLRARRVRAGLGGGAAAALPARAQACQIFPKAAKGEKGVRSPPARGQVAKVAAAHVAAHVAAALIFDCEPRPRPLGCVRVRRAARHAALRRHAPGLCRRRRRESARGGSADGAAALRIGRSHRAVPRKKRTPRLHRLDGRHAGLRHGAGVPIRARRRFDATAGGADRAVVEGECMPFGKSLRVVP